MDDIIETEEDQIYDLAREVFNKIETRRQIFLTEYMSEHKLEHPQDHPFVVRRLGESKAHQKVANEFVIQALREVLTPHVQKRHEAAWFRVSKLVKSMLPEPVKKKVTCKSKAKTKARLRQEMDAANLSIIHGTPHGELVIPGIRTKRIFEQSFSGLKSYQPRRFKKKKIKPSRAHEHTDEPLPMLNARQINQALALAIERHESTKVDFPANVPVKQKTEIMDFMSLVPKVGDRPVRKNWKKEVGLY